MVIQEIINKLDFLYPHIPIYNEEVAEGFEEPCFFIKVVSVVQKKELNNRYKRTYSYDIQHYTTTNEECNIMANELYENMEYLLDNTRSMNMHHEIVDKVLHFFVNYSMRLVKEIEESTKLNKLEVKAYGK